MKLGIPASIILLAIGLVSIPAFANQNQENRDRKDERNDRGGPEESTTLRVIPVVGANGQIQITSVIVIASSGEVLGALTEVGVRRVDEDRFDLSGVPLVGGLFGGGDDEDGPADPVRIGSAYVIGNTLAVDLAGSAAQPAAADQPAATEAERQAASAAIETRIADISGLGGDLTIDWRDTVIRPGALRVLNASYSYAMASDRLVVIGGLAESADDGGGKVPILGDVPLLGNLFRQGAGRAYLERRNLVVLIKPSILEDDYE